MKKLSKKIWIPLMIVLVIFAFGIGLLPSLFAKSVSSASAEEATYAQSYKDANVVYESVDKEIVINDEKVLDVTENIKVTYRQSGINVGLSRNVSKVNKITRIVDGEKYVSKTINKLDFISCKIKGEFDQDFRNEVAWVETEGDYFYILIGEDYDFKDKGTYTYQIKYRYEMGYSFIKEFDDFTFDIMDYGFQSPVKHFSCNVTFPKDILAGKQLKEVVTFRTNGMSPIGYEPLNVSYNEQNFNISCEYNDILSIERGFTMQVILDKGYFNLEYRPSIVYYLIVFSIAIALLAIIVCITLSRLSQKVMIVPEFYPPKGYSPIDVARIYRGEVRPKDVASLVIYWASVGLVELQPKKNKKYFIIKKLKEYKDVDLEGGAEYDSDRKEKAYFDALFSSSDIYDTEFASSRVNKKLGKAVEKLYERSDDGKTKQKILKAIVHVLSTLPFFLYIIWNIILDSSNFFMLFVFLFPLIGVMVFVYLRMPWQMLWFKLIWCGGFAGIPLVMMFTMLNSLGFDIWNLIYVVLAIFLLGNYSTRLIKVRPKADVEVLGRVLGFRKFLLKAELKKLERMVQDDPEYYYHILPFCYALGITRVMEKRFKSLRIEPPQYCEGVSTAYLCVHISHSIGFHSMSSSSGGGGFGGGGGGGGGSSGGGGGGGGCSGR